MNLTNKTTVRRKKSALAAANGQIIRVTKKSDLKSTRDGVALEASQAVTQLQGVQARIFLLFKRIEKTYKRAIKRAARKIVNDGKAD